MPEAEKDKPAVVPLSRRSRLVFRYGTAAVGVCVPFALGACSAPRINLIDDGNAWNCLRVTVDHGRKSDDDKAIRDNQLHRRRDLGPVGKAFLVPMPCCPMKRWEEAEVLWGWTYTWSLTT